MEIVRTVQNRSVIRNTFGPEIENQNQTPNSRRRWVTVCLLLICVLLVVALTLLYNHLKTQRDQMQNKVKEKSKALNGLNIKFNRLSDERDELQKKLKYINLIKLQLETNYSHLTDEREELQKNLKSVNQVKLELEAELKKRDCQKVSDRYFVSSDQKNWTDSRRFCKDRGGDLVIINTEEEQRSISLIAKDRFWIGLSDIEQEGNMKWVDNTPLTKGFWYEGEPNNERNEDCVEFMSSPGSESVLNNWNDLPCSQERKWICEN